MGSSSQNAWCWKWTLGQLNDGVIGITIDLSTASYEQTFNERASEGSAWSGYFSSAKLPAISKCIGLAFNFWWHDLCRILLVWDLSTIGKYGTRKVSEIIKS